MVAVPRDIPPVFLEGHYAIEGRNENLQPMSNQQDTACLTSAGQPLLRLPSANSLARGLLVVDCWAT